MHVQFTPIDATHHHTPTAPPNHLLFPFCFLLPFHALCREETHCRFCNHPYDLNWRNSLTTDTNSSTNGPATSANSSQQQGQPAARPPTPIMAIFFEGQVHRIKVYPGPEGKALFQRQIRELVQLSDDEEFEVEFECKAPGSGESNNQKKRGQQIEGSSSEQGQQWEGRQQ